MIEKKEKITNTERFLPMKSKLTVMFSALLGTAMFPSISMAQVETNIGQVSETLFEQFGAIGQLIVAGALILGVVLIIAGLLKLKAANDTQGQQVKWGDGIWRIIVGVALVSLLYFTGVGAATFGFDTDATLTGSGFGLGGE